MIYSSNNTIYTFWKKYTVETDNVINITTQLVNYNLENEWTFNLNLILSNIKGLNNYDNMIYQEFEKLYSIAQQKISDIISSLSFNNTKSTYILLKTIIGRYYNISNFNINFNDLLLAIDYKNIGNIAPILLSDSNSSSDYRNLPNNIKYLNLLLDNYTYLKSLQDTAYVNLISINANLEIVDEMKNLTPVDLTNVYYLIAMELVNNIINAFNLKISMNSFLILWRNCVSIRLYKKFLQFYQSTFLNKKLTDYNNNRNLTFYYSITPSNLFSCR
jgi:hypothetical protein